MTGKKSRKLIIIGIDSAPLWLLKKFSAEHDKKDGFSEVFGFGKRGVMDLESTIPPMTGAAWPSFYTGLQPSKHGSMDFFVLDRHYTKQLVYFDNSKGAFWDILGRRGFESFIITPPMAVSPSSEKNVQMMSGWPLAPRFSSNKIEKYAKKSSFAGEPEIERELKEGRITLEEASTQYTASARARARMTMEIAKHEDFDLLFSCFTETDRMQHYSLNNQKWENYVMPIYYVISEAISELYKYASGNYDDFAIMIVSDHGAQPIRSKFLINSWLIREGYANLKKSVEEKYNSQKSSPDARYKIREMLMRSKLRKVYDKMPGKIHNAAYRVAGSLLSGASAGSYTRIHDFDFDMRRTKAFASVSNGPISMIWVNDSRFDMPSVERPSKGKIKSEIKRRLMGIRSMGNGVIANVIDGEDYYGKNPAFIAPDLLIEAERGYTIDVFNYSNTSFYMKPEISRSGDHQRHGIFAVRSRSKNARWPGRGAWIGDINEYILEFFNSRR